MKNVSKIAIPVFLVVVLAAIAIIAGCAHSRLNTEATTSGIRAAEEVGASTVPQAALYLQMAREELDLAKELAAKDEGEQAASMLTRAEVDAQLAVTLSHGDAQRQEAEEAMMRVQQLRQDNP